MKRMLPMLLVLLLTACREAPPAPTVTLPTASGTSASTGQTGTTRTDSAAFLQTLWADFEEMVPFEVFGGTGYSPVWGGPGDLDLRRREELKLWYLIPEPYLSELHSGASLVHLMNPSILTLTAVQLKQPEREKDFLRAWQIHLQDYVWPCDSPQRMLIATVDDQMVMAYGRSDVLEDLRRSLVKTFPQTKMQCYGSLILN